jgi:hypothetical protein
MSRRYLRLYEPSAVAALTSFSRARWSRYVDQRLGVGYRQFEAAEALMASGELRLAAAAARTAVSTAPTILARPARLRRWARLALAGSRPRPPYPDDLLKRPT